MSTLFITLPRSGSNFVRRSYARDIAKLSLSELSSILRLSTKYSCSTLREEIIPHLKILFPSTRDVFQSRHRMELLPPDFNGSPASTLDASVTFPPSFLLHITFVRGCTLKYSSSTVSHTLAPIPDNPSVSNSWKRITFAIS